MSMSNPDETTVADAWQSFEKAAIPNGAGPNQRKAMQMAFYGGALAMFDLLARASTQNDDEEPSDREMLSVKTLYDELDKWGDEQVADRRTS